MSPSSGKNPWTKRAGVSIVLPSMAKKKEMTPLMKQYWGVKSAHPDKIVLFRMGDFFEMFHDDAVAAAPIMGIALTARNKKSGDQTPMCGVPHHSIASQINKLLNAGKKVAICDQVEDPKLAKGLVKREITRILSPGMVYDPDTLESHTPNYLCSFDEKTLAFMDSTTGECFFYKVKDEKRKWQLLDAINPVELVLSENQKEFVAGHSALVSVFEELFNKKGLPESAQRLLAYALYMQGEGAHQGLKEFEERDADFRLQVSAQVLRHLEIFRTYKGDREGTLFSAIDRTKTAGGGRRLRSWLLFPLTNKEKIEERHQEVEFWTGDLENLKEVRKKLFNVGDLERRLGKISQPTSHPRDLKSLAESMEAALELLPQMRQFANSKTVCAPLFELMAEIFKALVEEIPANFREGGFISKGFNADLDEYIDLSTDSQKKVRELEEKERELTGITSLKVRYNNVFGYYIEVTNTHKSKVPTDRYQRKQTLTNAERYVTDELNELEKKVIIAKNKRTELEMEIFNSLKDKTLKLMQPLLTLADQSNQLDVFTALAWLALEHNYAKPELVESGGIKIEGSRHPVIEQFVENDFIANDIEVGESQCILLTGPNMAGKSTIMRQLAITSLLAQAGSFVPARKAKLPVVDKIFTRIGASDFLTEGLSTFMVEMQETAEMLKEATPRSLVILDEVGRGTSTYDGMSLAQAILEYFLKELKSYTLFATHYHELTALESNYSGQLLNRHMSISEKNGEILFRYHLAEGPAEKSYGIQVAKLAGLPKPVIQHAGKILSQLETDAKPQVQTQQLDLWAAMSEMQEPEEVKSEFEGMLDSIRGLEIQKLTPLDALNKLAEFQEELL